jgi:hypothetical protein
MAVLRHYEVSLEAGPNGPMAITRSHNLTHTCGGHSPHDRSLIIDARDCVAGKWDEQTRPPPVLLSK